MKKYSHIIFFITLLSITSCIDLERELSTQVSEEQANNSYDFSLSRINSIYTDIPEGYLEIDGAMGASSSDESEHTLETSGVQKFNNGSWNSVDNPDNLWGQLYRGIRKANLFLENSDNIDLDQYKLDPSPSSQQVYKNRLAEIERWKSEARFLRAYFYFELVKRYGGVPLFAEAASLDINTAEVQRNSLQECIDFIVSESEAAATGLPLNYPNQDLGRATKGAALALKSRMLLYAASELFNNDSWAGGYSKPELISLDGSRDEKWKAAADAAKEVIDLSGSGYSLHNNYRSLFITNSFSYPEVIFTRRNSSSNGFEQENYPVGYDLGKGNTTPSQNLVDSYEVLTNENKAIPFDWDNPQHASNPYSKRDPRLNLTVIFNNSYYKGRNVQLYEGGLDGEGVVNASKTGYYLKKYSYEYLNLLQGQRSVKSWHIFRLSEIFLSYAEALNEYNPGNPDIATYVNMVRQRAGVKMPAIPSGFSQGEMRERIIHERRVELAFEGYRRWDLRRWMLAEEYLSLPLRGVDIVRTDDGGFIYTPIIVENRVFEARMYLYPIPLGETLISEKIIQNPGW
jgi:hypothetical protein